MSSPVTTFVPLTSYFSRKKLIPNDSTKEYLIPQYDIPYQNDQTLDTRTRPSQGRMHYVRTPVRVLEKHNWSDTHSVTILLCVQHTVLPIGTGGRSLSFTPVEVYSFY